MYETQVCINKNCGCEFIPTRKIQNYCSLKCYKSSRWKTEECYYCENKFKYLMSQKRTGNLFCSRECWLQYKDPLTRNSTEEVIAKYCPDCSLDLPVIEFLKSKSQSTGYEPYYKKCKYIRKSIRMYNLTREQVLNLLKNKECKICGDIQNLAIDHCHTTGEVRGLLCKSCNKALGFVREDIEILRNMILYLTKTH